MSEITSTQEIYDRIQRLTEASSNTALKVKALATGIGAICDAQSNDTEAINWLSQMAEELAQQINEKNEAVVTLIFQLRKQDPNIKP
jgi:pyridoxine/pyridoxamine 5'-phosphate oxidase